MNREALERTMDLMPPLAGVEINMQWYGMYFCIYLEKDTPIRVIALRLKYRDGKWQVQYVYKSDWGEYTGNSMISRATNEIGEEELLTHIEWLKSAADQFVNLYRQENGGVLV